MNVYTGANEHGTPDGQDRIALYFLCRWWMYARGLMNMVHQMVRTELHCISCVGDELYAWGLMNMVHQMVRTELHCISCVGDELYARGLMNMVHQMVRTELHCISCVGDELYARGLMNMVHQMVRIELHYTFVSVMSCLHRTSVVYFLSKFNSTSSVAEFTEVNLISVHSG